MECIKHNPWSCVFGPSITCNLIASVLIIYHMKLMHSTASEKKCFDLQSLSPTLRNLWLLLVLHCIIGPHTRLAFSLRSSLKACLASSFVSYTYSFFSTVATTGVSLTFTALWGKTHDNIITKLKSCHLCYRHSIEVISLGTKFCSSTCVIIQLITHEDKQKYYVK